MQLMNVLLYEKCVSEREVWLWDVSKRKKKKSLFGYIFHSLHNVTFFFLQELDYFNCLSIDVKLRNYNIFVTFICFNFDDYNYNKNYY